VKLSQSPALRFATECLVVTGKAEDVVPVPLAFDVYGEWALRESLSTRERRNKNDFKEDMIAALRARGVRYAANQTTGMTRSNRPAGSASASRGALLA
jgi:hypothetical protein